LGPSRLRKKFVRVFLLAGLVPLILMGAVSAYLVNLTHRIDVTALENNLASQVSGEIKKISVTIVDIPALEARCVNRLKAITLNKHTSAC